MHQCIPYGGNIVVSDFKQNELSKSLVFVGIDKGMKIPNSCHAEAICDVDDDGDKGNGKCSNLFKLDKFVSGVKA